MEREIIMFVIKYCKTCSDQTFDGEDYCSFDCKYGRLIKYFYISLFIVIFLIAGIKIFI